MKNCIFLVADKDMECSIKGILTRDKAIGMSQISYDINVHPQHDPGCRTSGTALLRNFSNQYEQCFLVFDYEGSGENSLSAEALEKQLEEQLVTFGWNTGTAHSLVINPELENWVWAQTQHLAELLGLSNMDSVTEWLEHENFTITDNQKPERPKEAFELRLEQIREPRSSALYKELASKVSFKNCTDRSFQKLIEILQNTFPAT